MRCYNCKNSNWIRVDKDFECTRMETCEKEDKERLEYFKSLNLKAGDKIKFIDDERVWLIQKKDDRFMICTSEDYYTILDIEDGIRGPDNHYGYYDYSELNAMGYEIALAQFHIKEPTSIHDLDVSPMAKDWYVETHSLDGTPYEDEFSDWDILEPLEISYRNFVNIELENYGNIN